jgi:predicted transposase/invertase (TIGR01784 family)
MSRLNPLNDFAFLKALGEKGDEPQLIAFLNAVLRRTGRKPIVSVEIIEAKELVPEIIKGKLCRLDVLAELADKSLVNIEVQLENEHNMEKRSVAYLSKLLSDRMKKGWDYKEIPQFIGINIIDFDYIPLEDFHTSFHFREDKSRDYVLTDMVEIHFLNMVKFRKVRNKDIVNDPLHRWLVFFDERSPEKMVQEAVELDEALQRIREKLDTIEMDMGLYHTYLCYDKTKFDEVNRQIYREEMVRKAVENGLKKGMEQGLKEGMEQGLKEGMEQGLKEGMEQGLKEGMEQGMAEAAAQVSQISAQLAEKDREIAELKRKLAEAT